MSNLEKESSYTTEAGNDKSHQATGSYLENLKYQTGSRLCCQLAGQAVYLRRDNAYIEWYEMKLASRHRQADKMTGETMQQRDELIRAMLVHIPFDGWSTAAISAAAADLGMDETATRKLLPDGVASAVDAFICLADRDMVAGLDALGEHRPHGVSSIIRTAILLRLEQCEPHREAVAAALRFLARPDQAALAARTLYRTCDRIWRITGDTAVDFSFYTKRATLAGVYSTTLLAWVVNTAGDRSRTEAVLDGQLRGVAMIPKLTAPAKKLAGSGFAVGRAIASGILSRMPRPTYPRS